MNIIRQPSLALILLSSLLGCQSPRITRLVGPEAWDYASRNAGVLMNEYKNLQTHERERFVALNIEDRTGKSVTCYGVALMDDPNADVFVLDLPTIFEGSRMTANFASGLKELPSAWHWGRAFPSVLVRLDSPQPELIWCRCAKVDGQVTPLVWRCWPERKDLLCLRVPSSGTRYVRSLWARPKVYRGRFGRDAPKARIRVSVVEGYVTGKDDFYVDFTRDGTLNRSTVPEWLKLGEG